MCCWKGKTKKRLVESVDSAKRFALNWDHRLSPPISRDVELTAEQKKLYNKLVEDGFSEEFYLGKAQAAELNIRLQDICIGYEPLKDEDGNISYRAFKENPKLEALIDLLEEIDDQEQVVIWCSRKNAIKSIAESASSGSYFKVMVFFYETVVLSLILVLIIPSIIKLFRIGISKIQVSVIRQDFDKYTLFILIFLGLI